MYYNYVSYTPRARSLRDLLTKCRRHEALRQPCTMTTPIHMLNLEYIVAMKKIQVNKQSLIDLALRLLHTVHARYASYRPAIDKSDWLIQTFMVDKYYITVSQL
jgi:hypothetical protein